MFVDHLRIHARAGDGGDGASSFRREKFVPNGGPDGGDGGRGGDIILQADPHTDNLVSLFYKPIIRAKSGDKGGGRQKSGKSAPNTLIKVPIGTLVYRLPEGERISGTVVAEADEFEAFMDLSAAEKAAGPKEKFDPSDLELVVDMVESGMEFVLCKGGDGGKGNMNFKTSTNQAPRKFIEGFPGDEGYFYVELRKIAEVGLVGYPNAGKSTLLRAISAATPKVAPYPFTTLTPHIGIVELDDFRRLAVADIPGLIEGAHLNVGLGHDFLRHIVRCRALFFVVDMSGSEGREPEEDLMKLREELAKYDPTLPDRPWIVVANKMDLPEAAQKLKHFKRRFRKVEVLAISANTNEGIDDLKKRLSEWAQQM